jgi:galactoside O-acetyltransferase
MVEDEGYGMQPLIRLLRAALYNPRRHIRRLPFVSIGQGTVILPTARFVFRQGEAGFQGRIRIGSEALVGGEFIFESERGEVSIGDGTFINGGTRLICRERIDIGAQVTIAWGCTLYDHNSHSLSWQDTAMDIRQQITDIRAGRNFIQNKDWSTVRSRPICVADKAWVGFGVTVLNGVRIGEGAIVGACSVVRDDVPDWAMVYGNPARVVKQVRGG